MTTIKNGLVYYKGELLPLDIAIDGGKITAIAKDLPSSGEIIDATGLVVCHGFIDLHVHLREPGFAHKETITCGTAAAAAGGFTTVCSMPNLNPVPDSVEHIKAQTDIISRDALVNVLPFGAITVGQAGKTLVDYAPLLPYTCGFSDDGRGVQSPALMEAAMEQATKLGFLISAHCEEDSLLDGGYIHKGEYAKANMHCGISSESEYVQVERDVALALKTGAKYHVCHISTKESIAAIRHGKCLGGAVSCEVTPHHIALCDTDIESDHGRFKMNPPLRGVEDRDAIIDGILDGTIDCIATDHAPHSDEEKSRGLKASAMGVVGSETAWPVCHTKLVLEQGVPLTKLLDLLTAGGRLIGVPHTLEVGSPADITILDTKTRYTINPTSFKSLGKSTPFSGMAVQGRVIKTLVNGKEVYSYAK